MSSPGDLLSKRHRNDLFRAIEQSGAPINEFELHVGKLSGDKSDSVIIDHLGSKSFFAITLSLSSKLFFVIKSRPSARFRIVGRIDDGEKTATDGQRATEFIMSIIRPHLGSGLIASFSWDVVRDMVETWARKIIEKREAYALTPDLWLELRQSKTLLTAPHVNTAFTESQQAQITSQIQQVKAFIKNTYELTGEQIAEVEERLDQVEQASRRMGRKDWLMLFNGAVFSLIVSGFIPPQAAQHILLMTLHGLGHLFGVGGAPPHLAPHH